MTRPKYDYLIVGAGLYGAMFAHTATLQGKKCLVIERITTSEVIVTLKMCMELKCISLVRTSSGLTPKKFGTL